jgi:RNA polymerase sigma-70 factor (ECF subfamily)
LEPLQAALEAYCRRSVKDPNAVEDVLQEAIGTAYRDFHLYAEGTNFRAWIFRYLNLTIHRGNRSYQRERFEALSAEPPIEDVWDQAIDEPLIDMLLERPYEVLRKCEDAIAAAIAELSPLERSVLLLRAIGQFKNREMSDILEVPMGTVMSAVSRGRTRLRMRLAEYARERNLFPNGPSNRK